MKSFHERNESMNKESQTTDCGPHIGDLLRFVSLRMDNPNSVNVSVDDIMRMFNIDSYEAGELIEQLELGFAEKIGVNQYRLTEIGIKEIDRMNQSGSENTGLKGTVNRGGD